MKNKYTPHIIVLCWYTTLVFTPPAYGQELPRKDYVFERLADEIFPVQDLDLNYEELYENLAQILTNPLDLNRATREELRSLFILSEEQLEDFIHYRNEDGPLLSVYELQSVPQFTTELINKLAPFVIVTDPAVQINRSLIRRVLHEENNYLIYRFARTQEIKKGYRAETDSSLRYEGSPDTMYARFRVAHSGDYSIGFTAEKDAGERLSWNPKQDKLGADYLSFHAQLLNKGKIRNIIMGDYQAQFGQWLLLGGGFGMGKGSESITTIRRSNLGFLPYTSLNESGFFRGAAISYDLARNISVNSFFSSVKRDGNTEGIADDAATLTSFPVT